MVSLSVSFKGLFHWLSPADNEIHIAPGLTAAEEPPAQHPDA